MRLLTLLLSLPLSLSLPLFLCLALRLSIVLPRFVWHSIVFISAAVFHLLPSLLRCPTSASPFGCCSFKIIFTCCPLLCCAVQGRGDRGQGCQSILRVFLLHFVFMHLQWQFLSRSPSLSFSTSVSVAACSCCTLRGAWKAYTDDNATTTCCRVMGREGRHGRGRQSRFYATFYDCQQ